MQLICQLRDRDNVENRSYVGRCTEEEGIRDRVTHPSDDDLEEVCEGIDADARGEEEEGTITRMS